MPDETAPATPVAQPITSQDVTPPAASAPDQLEAQHSADNFKALNELFDKVETPPAPTPVTTDPTPEPVAPTTPPTPTPVAPEPDAFEKTLDALKPSERAHPNVIKAADELRRIGREEHKARLEAELKLQELQPKLTELEAKAQEAKIPEEVQKKIEALEAFRREVDLRLDPEFQKNYVAPVQEAESNIANILREAGLKDEHLEFIQKHGGIVAMSRSTEELDLANGKTMTAQEWVENELLARTPTFHRNRALGELTNALNVQDKGSKELLSFREQGKERYEAKVKQFTEQFNQGRDAAIAELGDAVKPKVITPTMTAEERLAAEAHNNRLREAEIKFAEYIKTSQDPKVSGRIVVRATQADVLFADNQTLQAENAQLKQELASIKASGDFTKAGDNAPPIPPGPPQPDQKGLLRIGDNQALSDLLTGAGITR